MPYYFMDYLVILLIIAGFASCVFFIFIYFFEPWLDKFLDKQWPEIGYYDDDPTDTTHNTNKKVQK